MSDSPSARANAPATIDRINLRLPPETFAAIDQSRAARPGHVSRNTWLTEAVAEKLAREGAGAVQVQDRQHG
jgi:hypothetical protein